MKSPTSHSPVRQRILDAAADLFYRQGYRATGINQIIAESGVAKASFYDHFPSKDDLLRAYAIEMSRKEFELVRQEVDAFPTARERFFGPLTILPPWFESSDYRGCPFQIMVAEAPPDSAGVREVARRHRETFRRYLHQLTGALMVEEPTLARADAAMLVDSYLLLFEGSIALAVAYRESWPVERAITTLETLLDSQRR
ncbi:MAG TPA: TetR/AcrR family transcriptional regulator [Candidatus Sumerlaeota bacterium]|nr:MAG: putative HTH-type transcriptional regulator YxaF [candidate division BRC1 bacterium ADurb.BinA292]HOE95663.1 TetR/AcrR family transcriptional regulator [Candidatus Sumerlaeota bacterium]HOR27388.1 TetR/AcrR family transcriptional regulator [Candidatus Sumerlaeota bacterium]HPK01941.1 TetR/AcrR family transcriptional regulator [Candidatus Sumerlaeota bacterium]